MAAPDTTPGPHRPPVVIAVVSWNTRERLRDCLHSLEAEAVAGTAAVWVVDNASDDGSAELVRTAFPWADLIASPRNLGFGTAINAVATHTAGPDAPDWIAAANADVVLAPGALQALLDAGRTDPSAAIVAPRLVLGDGSSQHSIHAFPTLGSTLAFNLGLASLSPRLGDRLTLEGHWDRDASRRVDWAHGAFLLIRRRAFDQVHGFDPEQFLYAEDLDIAWRLARDGWHARYEPAATVHHAHAAAISQLYGDDRDFRAQRSAYAWMLRRHGAAQMRTCALLNTLGAGARAALATPAAAMHGGDAGLRAWRLRRHARIHLDGLMTPRSVLERHR